MACYCTKPFEIKHHIKSSVQRPGGDFNGPTIKNILKNKNLTNLINFLPLHLSPFVEYLRTIENVHILLTAKTLPQNYKNILADFREKLDYLYYNFNQSMTVKIHVIYHNFEDYFELSRETLQTKLLNTLNLHTANTGYMKKYMDTESLSIWALTTMSKKYEQCCSLEQ